MNLRPDPEVTRIVREVLKGSTLYIHPLEDYLTNEMKRDIVYRELLKELKVGRGKNMQTKIAYFCKYISQFIQKYKPNDKATLESILSTLKAITVSRDNKLYGPLSLAISNVSEVLNKGKGIDPRNKLSDHEEVNMEELLNANGTPSPGNVPAVRTKGQKKAPLSPVPKKKASNQSNSRIQGNANRSGSRLGTPKKAPQPKAAPKKAGHSKAPPKAQPRKVKQSKLKPKAGNPPPRPTEEPPRLRKGTRGDEHVVDIRSKRQAPGVPDRALSFKIPENHDMIIVNMVAMKGARNLIPRKMKGTLFHCGVFGSQFKKDSTGGDFDTGNTLTVVRFERAEFIEFSRQVRQEEISEYKKNGTLRKPSKPKFQTYKHYYEQSPLGLDIQALKLVVDASVYPSVDDKSSAKAAAKVLFKLMMDIYNEDGIEGFKSIKLILNEMIDVPSDMTRARAFNVLFNLAIHCHFYHPDIGAKVYPLLHEITDNIFCDLALQVFYSHERSPVVWHAILMCFLFFFSDGVKGTKRPRVLRIDPRIIVSMLDYLELSDSIRTYLIRILVNLLYVYERGSLRLDIGKLNMIGGMGKILYYYMHSHSMEVRNNLFAVNFDYIMRRLTSKKSVDSESERKLFEIMKHFDIAHIFPQALRYLPKKFTEMFMDYVVKDRLERYEMVANSIDRTLILQFLELLEHHTLSYWKLEPELEMFRDELKGPRGSEYLKSLENLKNTIFLLASSDDETNRHQGMTLLFELMVSTIEVKDIGDPKALKQLVNGICTQLVNSKNSKTRLVYYRITSKLLQLYKTRDSRGGSSIRLFQLINSQFQNVRHIGESDQTNLIAVFDTIVELITILPAQYVPRDAYSPKYQDTFYQHILSGRAMVQSYLLKSVDIQILLHIFNNLSRANADAMTVCLLLVLEKCKQSPSLYNERKNEKLYRKLVELLHGKDPRIAFFVSQFLTGYMLDQRPKEYAVFEKKVMNLNGPLSQFLQVKICKELFF